jgi:hypothetical protein
MRRPPDRSELAKRSRPKGATRVNNGGFRAWAANGVSLDGPTKRAARPHFPCSQQNAPLRSAALRPGADTGSTPLQSCCAWPERLRDGHQDRSILSRAPPWAMSRLPRCKRRSWVAGGNIHRSTRYRRDSLDRRVINPSHLDHSVRDASNFLQRNHDVERSLQRRAPRGATPYTLVPNRTA